MKTCFRRGGINIRAAYSHASRSPLASFAKIQTSRLTTSTCEGELLTIRPLMMKGGHYPLDGARKSVMATLTRQCPILSLI
jgi:hypothetical protein